MTWTMQEAANTDAFTSTAVKWIADRIEAAIADTGYCIIGLSGGSTPKKIYEALGQKIDIDWEKVKIFLIDERYVAASDEKSNQTLVRSTLLNNASIPEENCAWPDTSLPLDECIKAYTLDLKKQWAEHLPHIMILGMGDDGHIASLFPPLEQRMMDDTRLVIHTTTDRFDVHDRIGLTLNPITVASSHLLLLQGEQKKATWDAMMKSDEDESRWPMKRILAQPDVTILIG